MRNWLRSIDHAAQNFPVTDKSQNPSRKLAGTNFSLKYHPANMRRAYSIFICFQQACRKQINIKILPCNMFWVSQNFKQSLASKHSLYEPYIEGYQPKLDSLA